MIITMIPMKSKTIVFDKLPEVDLGLFTGLSELIRHQGIGTKITKLFSKAHIHYRFIKAKIDVLKACEMNDAVLGLLEVAFCQNLWITQIETFFARIQCIADFCPASDINFVMH